MGETEADFITGDTDTRAAKNGGEFHVNGPNGCVDYKLYGPG